MNLYLSELKQNEISSFSNIFKNGLAKFYIRSGIFKTYFCLTVKQKKDAKQHISNRK